MKRLIRAVLIPLIVLLLLSGIALALTYLDVISVNVQVTQGQYVARVYSDSGATQRITELSPAIEPNQAHVQTVYVKNEGTQPMDVTMLAQGNTAFGMVLFNPATLTLVSGEVKPVEVTVFVLPDAVPGSYNYSLIVGR